MRITIFSPGGMLGQAVTNAALSHGDQVTVYLPDASAVWPRKNLTVIEGTMRNREKILEALLEADSVISVLFPMARERAQDSRTPMADGNAMILSAMQQLGKTKFVTVGPVCMHSIGECEDALMRLFTRMTKMLCPGLFKDMQKLVQILKASDIDWTLVRAYPTHSARDGRSCGILPEDSRFWRGVSEQSLADFLYQMALDQGEYRRKMPVLSEKSKKGKESRAK